MKRSTCRGFSFCAAGKREPDLSMFRVLPVFKPDGQNCIRPCFLLRQVLAIIDFLPALLYPVTVAFFCKDTLFCFPQPGSYLFLIQKRQDLIRKSLQHPYRSSIHCALSQIRIAHDPWQKSKILQVVGSIDQILY